MTTDSYAVEAQVNGLFATVSTTIVFGNPNGRVLEGELEFPLPEGAAWEISADNTGWVILAVAAGQGFAL